MLGVMTVEFDLLKIRTCYYFSTHDCALLLHFASFYAFILTWSSLYIHFDFWVSSLSSWCFWLGFKQKNLFDFLSFFFVYGSCFWAWTRKSNLYGWVEPIPGLGHSLVVQNFTKKKCILFILRMCLAKTPYGIFTSFFFFCQIVLVNNPK